MKKPILANVCVTLLVTLAFGALAASPADRPPGVAEHDWIKLNDRIGFVIIRGKAAPVPGDSTGLYLAPPTEGYFMLKGLAGWSRIIVVEPIKGPAAAG